MTNIVIVTHKKFTAFLAVVIMGIVLGSNLLPSEGIAEESVLEAVESGHESGGELKKIQPVPNVKAVDRIKSGRVEDFFDVVGTVTMIDDRRIRLGDREFNIADGVDLRGIKRGDRLGVRLKKKQEVVEFERLKDVPH